MHTLTDSYDPAFRAAAEKLAELPLPPLDREVLWHDAELLAQSDGAPVVTATHLRQALRLQYGAAEAIKCDPEWSREERLVRRHCRGDHGADRLDA